MKNIKGIFFKVLVRKRNNDFAFEDKSLFSAFVEVKPRIGFWAADPFVIKINNINYLFVEMCSIFSGNGYIAYMNLDRKDSKWKTVIKDKTHYSFPFVFASGDKLMIMPENSQKRAVVNYSLSFSGNEFVCKTNNTIITNIKAVDTISYLHNGNVYFLTYVLDSINHLDVFLYKDSKIISLQSIKDHNNLLRPAGKIFEYNGELILPTQNSIVGYGDDIVFNIIQIGDDGLTFLGTLNCSVTQSISKKYNGSHTYNFNDSYEVIDARYYCFSFLRIVGKLYRVIIQPRKEKPLIVA